MNYFLIFIFSIIIGFIGHFLYKFSNYNKIVALFFAVNESTWEHIKIGLTPLFLCTFIDAFFNGYVYNYWFNKFILIPLLFYFYKFFLKKHVLIIDIFIFVFSVFVSILLNYYLDYTILNYNLNYIGIIGILFIIVAYLKWTFYPPKNFLFKDPITNTYGMDNKH